MRHEQLHMITPLRNETDDMINQAIDQIVAEAERAETQRAYNHDGPGEQASRAEALAMLSIELIRRGGLPAA